MWPSLAAAVVAPCLAPNEVPHPEEAHSTMSACRPPRQTGRQLCDLLEPQQLDTGTIVGDTSRHMC